MNYNKFKQIDGIFFDWDGTLVDVSRGLKTAHWEISEKIHQYSSKDEGNFSIKSIQKKVSNFDDRMNKKKIFDRDSWWPRLFEEIGMEEKLTRSKIDELSELYWKTFSEEAVPYADTESTLKYLDEKGYLLGIITDTDGPTVTKRNRITKYDFCELFEVLIICGEDSRNTKPSPEPFEKALKKSDLRAKNCVMIGDKPFADIKGGKAAGMHTILVEKDNWENEVTPDLTIKSLKELRTIL